VVQSRALETFKNSNSESKQMTDLANIFEDIRRYRDGFETRKSAEIYLDADLDGSISDKLLFKQNLKFTNDTLPEDKNKRGENAYPKPVAHNKNPQGEHRAISTQLRNYSQQNNRDHSKDHLPQLSPANLG
jgi:hypothetical protein